MTAAAASYSSYQQQQQQQQSPTPQQQHQQPLISKPLKLTNSSDSLAKKQQGQPEQEQQEQQQQQQRTQKMKQKLAKSPRTDRTNGGQMRRLANASSDRHSGGFSSSGGASNAGEDGEGDGGGGSGGGGGGGGAGSTAGSRSCCLCWCCCCSCLSSKPSGQDESSRLSGNPQPAKDPSLRDFDSISKEEALVWGESFEKLMQSSNGRKAFREFLKSEYSEENILFWLACEELKKEVTPEAIEERARIIYEDYISILSPKEVSLDARVREIINKNMVEPTAHTFDDAQVQIFTLMHRDSYPRFLNSQFYKMLVNGGDDESSS